MTRLPNEYAGGHRSRAPPVPIPNTEVKPATADGTARETVWESRSLPAVLPKPAVLTHTAGFSIVRKLSSARGESERREQRPFRTPLPSSPSHAHRRVGTRGGTSRCSSLREAAS